MSNRPKDTLNKKTSFDILINGSPLDTKFRVNKIYTKKEINKISRANVQIYGGDIFKNEFSEIEDDLFNPGNEIEIKMGYDQSNSTVFKGVIESRSVAMSNGYQNDPDKSLLKIDCVDKSIMLTNSFTNEIYENMSESDIINNLINNVSGLSSNIDSIENTHDFFSKYNNNDWEFIVDRAAMNGLVVINSNNSISVVSPSCDGSSELTISNSGQTYSFHAKEQTENQIKSVTINSVDSFNNEQISSSSSEPSDNMVSSDNLNIGDLDSFSPDEVVFNYAYDLSQDEIESISLSKVKYLRLNRIQGKTSFKGVPELEIDSVVSIEGFGDKFDGDIYVSAVIHEIYEGELITEISFGLNDNIFSKYKLNKSYSVNKISGVHIGKITDIETDPMTQYRVKVVIPELKSISSNIWDNIMENGIWAKLSHTYVSEDSGFYFLPEIGTQVIVSFLGENPTQPVVLGSLYTNENKPYKNFENLNNYKAIVSNNKMMIEFDAENQLLNISTEQGNKIVLDEQNSKISMIDVNGNEINLSQDGINLISESDIVLSSKGKVSISGSSGIDIQSSSDVSVQGTNIKNTANAKFSADGSAGIDINSSAITTVKGSMVQIN